MATIIRPLETEDLQVLTTIDDAYARANKLEPMLTPGCLSFYRRSGHAFVAVEDGKARGFLLAHAVWDGSRPVVRVTRVAVRESADVVTRELLLEALTKSAYDAAAYDIIAESPLTDAGGICALETKGYQAVPVRLFRRVLGSGVLKQRS